MTDGGVAWNIGLGSDYEGFEGKETNNNIWGGEAATARMSA